MTDGTKTTGEKRQADDIALLGLYQHLTQNKAERQAKEKAYFAAKMREHRAKAREAKASGTLRPTPAFARDVLADAAMRILAADGPGAGEIRAALKEAFAAMPAYAATVEGLIVKGRLKTKYLPLDAPEPERARRVVLMLPEAPTPARVQGKPRASHVLSAVAQAAADDADFRPPDFLLRDR
jgi:hypothetical protein